MPIHFSCSICGKTISAGEGLIGSTTSCTHCKSSVTVPEKSTVQAPTTVPVAMSGRASADNDELTLELSPQSQAVAVPYRPRTFEPGEPNAFKPQTPGVQKPSTWQPEAVSARSVSRPADEPLSLELEEDNPAAEAQPIPRSPPPPQPSMQAASTVQDTHNQKEMRIYSAHGKPLLSPQISLILRHGVKLIVALAALGALGWFVWGFIDKTFLQEPPGVLDLVGDAPSDALTITTIRHPDAYLSGTLEKLFGGPHDQLAPVLRDLDRELGALSGLKLTGRSDWERLGVDLKHPLGVISLPGQGDKRQARMIVAATLGDKRTFQGYLQDQEVTYKLERTQSEVAGATIHDFSLRVLAVQDKRIYIARTLEDMTEYLEGKKKSPLKNSTIFKESWARIGEETAVLQYFNLPDLSRQLKDASLQKIARNFSAASTAIAAQQLQVLFNFAKSSQFKPLLAAGPAHKSFFKRMPEPLLLLTIGVKDAAPLLAYLSLEHQQWFEGQLKAAGSGFGLPDELAALPLKNAALGLALLPHKGNNRAMVAFARFDGLEGHWTALKQEIESAQQAQARTTATGREYFATAAFELGLLDEYLVFGSPGIFETLTKTQPGWSSSLGAGELLGLQLHFKQAKALLPLDEEDKKRMAVAPDRATLQLTVEKELLQAQIDIEGNRNILDLLNVVDPFFSALARTSAPQPQAAPSSSVKNMSPEEQIAQNEVRALGALKTITAAQQEYYNRPTEDGVKRYAQNLRGTLASLYDPTAKIELIPQELSNAQHRTNQPFHGYAFFIVYGQGSHAPGGAKSYRDAQRKHLTEGFGIVAYPRVYKRTGINTYISSHDGVIYKKDLGPATENSVATIRAYDPDASWVKVD